MVTLANKKLGLTLVAYPESLPSDWVLQLEQLPLGFCYALHDKDTDENGKTKKAHVHIYFQGTPNAKQKKYISQVTGISYLIDVRSASDMFEYLTHENHSDKYHYDKSIIHYSNDWSQEAFEMLCKTEGQKNITYGEIIDIVKTNKLKNMYELTEYINANCDDAESYFLIMRKNAYQLKEYLYWFSLVLKGGEKNSDEQ